MFPSPQRLSGVLLTALWLIAAQAHGQTIPLEIQRNSPKVLSAFHDVVSRASQSTVRVRSDGHDVALGTVIASDGWILTKASELNGVVTCRLPGDRDAQAKIVGVQEAYDLALLKVHAKDLTPVDWRKSSDLHVGQWVASAGPQARPIAVGVVSVGTRKFKQGDQPPRNLGAKSGYLGVALDEAEGGARIVAIAANSPAAKSGLKIGDLVVEADRKKVLDNESLINAVQRHHPGDEIALKVKRGDEELEIQATLSRMPPFLLGNPQERMGNKLSNRRGGFPTILQHDTVLPPDDCGGPLVDLDGKAVGVNIARAGRTETYAIPAEDIEKLLPELKSGKLAPQAETAVRPPRKADPRVILHEDGRLTDKEPLARFRRGCHSREYTVQFKAGERYAIELDSSDFDAYLRVEGPDGKKREDDDSGGELNARIEMRAPDDGQYRIIVTTCEPGETGSFELTVRRLGAAETKEKGRL